MSCLRSIIKLTISWISEYIRLNISYPKNIKENKKKTCQVYIKKLKKEEKLKEPDLWNEKKNADKKKFSSLK